jgi:hypothetical protein
MFRMGAMTMRTNTVAGSRSAESSCPDEAGFALITVTLMAVVFLLLALVASGTVIFNLSSSTHVNAMGTADGAANAGLAATLYDIETGNFVCSLSNSLPSTFNAGTDSYSATVNYYTSYSDAFPPATGSGNPMTCSSGTLAGATPAAAVLQSTGTARFGGVTQTETIKELVDITQVSQDYALFSANSGISFTSNLEVLAQSGAGSSTGVLYANGDVAGPTGGGSCTIGATIVALGTLSVANNCTVSGSIYLGTDSSGKGSLTLSQATVDGNVTVSSGDVTMSNSTVDQNVVAGGTSPNGDIWLCPNPIPPSPTTSCTGLSAGKSTIDGSAIASGTVTLNATSESTTCPTVGVVQDPSRNDTVDTCITAGSTSAVTAPNAISLPTVYYPESTASGGNAGQNSAYNAWTAAGYTVESTSTCTGKLAGSLWYDINNASSSTAIVANCAVDFTNTAPYSLSNSNLNHNVALFAPDGVTFGGGFKFNNPSPAGTTAQLSIIVPTPSGAYSCSGGGYNITWTGGSGGDIPAGSNGVYTDFFTPCTISVGDNVSTYGEAIAGSFSLSKQFYVTYQPFTIPALTFGYQTFVEERYITSG